MNLFFDINCSLQILVLLLDVVVFLLLFDMAVRMYLALNKTINHAH
jgi:hypothetical protein